jgi:hypothetical protein
VLTTGSRLVGMAVDAVTKATALGARAQFGDHSVLLRAIGASHGPLLVLVEIGKLIQHVDALPVSAVTH